MYDRIRTSARDAVRWQVRAALEVESTRDLAELPRVARQRERLRVASELKQKQQAKAILRENVRRAVVELAQAAIAELRKPRLTLVR